ncbi:MAG: hypothetical protein JWO62_38 [Acidimicrobiaceae bacterium]|nr:hypothetical protein [Acidimicrobiaceae bacterium]
MLSSGCSPTLAIQESPLPIEVAPQNQALSANDNAARDVDCDTRGHRMAPFDRVRAVASVNLAKIQRRLALAGRRVYDRSWIQVVFTSRNLSKAWRLLSLP